MNQTMHRSRSGLLPLALASAAALFAPACTTFDHAGYAEVSEAHGITLRLDGAPTGSEPLGIVYAEVSGFSVFTVWDWRSATMAEGLEGLASEAKALGADGVAEITMSRDTGSVFVDWFPSVQLYGQAYKLPR